MGYFAGRYWPRKLFTPKYFSGEPSDAGGDGGGGDDGGGGGESFNPFREYSNDTAPGLGGVRTFTRERSKTGYHGA